MAGAERSARRLPGGALVLGGCRRQSLRRRQPVWAHPEVRAQAGRQSAASDSRAVGRALTGHQASDLGSSLSTGRRSRRLLGSLYVQVLIGIALGALLGFLSPESAVAMRPLGDGFIKIVRMLIAPVVFTTVVVGIAQMGAMKDVGRIGFRALVYFELVSTLALAIGLVVVKVLKPGEGIAFDPATADLQSVSAYTTASRQLNGVDFILHIIPDTMVGAFSQGEIIQVLFVAILVGLALLRLGQPMAQVVDLLAKASHVLFDIVGLIMKLAP
ncbi:MAG: cation:dicarboxylase symporter family transporter, partial [Acidobacteria bacterium]|nr:cation:dicarboxylase symporter family transporter [Acidobacteriota bacterium]